MTIEEIRQIILKVEQNGADPNTEISEACHRYGYITTQLADIRINIESKLAPFNISIFPNMSPDEKYKTIQKYKGSRLTTLLANNRTNKHKSYSNDGFREIHDIFMDSYISDRRKKKGNNDHTFFLTSNRDLIAFCKEAHHGENNMKSMGKVILELWMHNAKPSDISECAFAEKMACCLDFHNARVSREIALVSSFYNKTKDNFNQQVFDDFIAQLYRRAKNSILTADIDPDELAKLGADLGQRIKNAVEEDKKSYNASLANAIHENKMLSANIAEKEKEISEVQTQNKEQADRIKALSDEKEKELVEHEKTKNKLSELEKSLDAEAKKKEAAENRAKQYLRRDTVSNELIGKRKDFNKYKDERDKSFTEVLPGLLFALSICFFISALAIVIYFLHEKNSPFNIYFAGSAALCVGSLASGLSIKGSNWYKEKKEKSYRQWDVDHKDIYNKTRLEIESLESEYKELEKSLGSK